MKLQKGHLSNIPGRSEAELSDIIGQLHEANAKAAAGKISWAERQRIHDLLVPGIPKLGGHSEQPRTKYEPRTVDVSEVRHALRDLE